MPRAIIPAELAPKIMAAYAMGISAKVIAKALPMTVDPHTLAQWCYRQRGLPLTPDFRAAFEALFR